MLISRYINLQVKSRTCLFQLVDSEVVMLSAHWEKKRNSLVELQDQLQQIPGFLADLECLTASLGKAL